MPFAQCVATPIAIGNPATQDLRRALAAVEPVLRAGNGILDGMLDLVAAGAHSLAAVQAAACAQLEQPV